MLACYIGLMKSKMNAEVAPAKSGQHTPGPWQVENKRVSANEIDTWIYAPKAMDGHRHICMLDSDGRTAANARLIAAAPALVEALQEIAERGPVAGYESASALRLRLVGSQTIARAALRAATGKGETQ